jgi:ABC-2 type transport system permease protein
MTGPAAGGTVGGAPAALPGAATAGTGRVRAFGPLARVLARGLVGRRRSLGVLLLAAAPVALAAILAFAGGLGDPAEIALEVYATLTLALVTPLVALVLGTGVLGALIDDGTIVYLLVKPVPRRTVVLAAMVVAAAATSAVTVTSAALTALLLVGLASPGLVLGMVLGVALASVLYVVVFVALSVLTGRALVVGLGYVLVWEGIVTSFFAGTRILSIREYALAIVAALGGDTAAPVREGVELPVALLMAVLILGGGFVLGSRRLARFEVAEAG